MNRISFEVAKSSYAGGILWIGYSSARESASIPSIASPVTFSRRPLICLPIGTEIGEPFGVTSIPRTRPSVESIAMVRIVFSPICC